MKTIARVRVTVEIPLDGYGDEWKLCDICDNAKRDASQRVRVMIANSPYKIVGEPSVCTISTEES